MQLSDYHNHTPLCRHAEGHPSDYVASGISRGLSEIGISDHSPMPTLFDDWRMLIDELPSYFELIQEAREAHPGFPIRFGLEVDFLTGYEGWVEQLAEMTEWDYLIGAVHYITPDWDVDNPKWVGSGRWEEQSVEDVWQLYWDNYTKAIRSGLFDFFAHPDLPKKFRHIPSGDLRRFYEPAIQAAVDVGGVFEINTAGLRNTAGEQYPAREFIEMAVAAGIPFVISSDAHKPSDVGRDFDKAWKLLWDCGGRKTVRFNNRKRTIVDLSSPLASNEG